MGVKKNQKLQVPVPIHICYEALHKSASELGWKNLINDKSNFVIKWESKGSLWTKKVKVTAELERLSSDNTDIFLTGEIPGLGLVDGPGNIPRTWKMLLEPFYAEIATAHMIQEGLLCPTCGEQLPTGTRFCPKDGTLIAIACNKCGNINAPSARFCSTCGEMLQSD